MKESRQLKMRHRNDLGAVKGKRQRNPPSLDRFLKDNIRCRGLLQHWICEPNWLRRGWPGAGGMGLGSWEEQRESERRGKC